VKPGKKKRGKKEEDIVGKEKRDLPAPKQTMGLWRDLREGHWKRRGKKPRKDLKFTSRLKGLGIYKAEGILKKKELIQKEGTMPPKVEEEGDAQKKKGSSKKKETFRGKSQRGEEGLVPLVL